MRLVIRVITAILFLTGTPADTLAPAIAVAGKTEMRVTGMVSGIESRELRRYGVNNPKGITAIVPGLFLPEYGASLTSSIYVRGLGSRMENPVVGLYIDDFPILDKNSYDLDYLDIESIRFLHGPQGTAYGRNSLAGVLSVKTAMQDGLRATLEYGTRHHIAAGLSGGYANHSFSAAYRHSSGYFPNAYTGKMCDPFDGGQFRWRWEKPYGDLTLGNILQAGISSEGGFAYGAWKDGEVQPVNYNDEGSYRRITVLEGFKARLRKEHIVLDLMASAQILADDMRMDQDYTPQSVFTLQQKQLSGAQTFEAIARPTRRFRHWKPTTGFFGFFKACGMDAPVLFKRDGIENLILANANGGIPDDIGYLEIPDASFPVDSRFTILSWNAALYHESVFSVNRWTFTAGLRIDYEGAWMGYDCYAALHYRMVPFMASSKPFEDTYTGSLFHGGLQILPKLAVQFAPSGKWMISASATKGYRAGGFNTQIFSDILQNRMMNGLMADLGVYLDRPMASSVADNTEYQPEELWNFEAGVSFKGEHLRADATAFYSGAVNQQLTVFPPGMTTGRMMTNAGRSRSYGVEMQVSYEYGGFRGRASWGWNDARFTVFDDGQADYSGNRIPHSPGHTLFASAGYFGGRFEVEAHVRGIGPIAWNEANTLEEPFYATLGADARVRLGRFQVYLRGENLTGTRYRTFYFKSMGNEFFQVSKPAIVTLGVQVSLL